MTMKSDLQRQIDLLLYNHAAVPKKGKQLRKSYKEVEKKINQIKKSKT